MREVTIHDKITHIYVTVVIFFIVGMFFLSPISVRADTGTAKWTRKLNLSESLTQDASGNKWSCTLTWSAIKGCGSYEICRTDNSAKHPAEQLIATVSDGSCRYAEQGLAYQSCYTYYVYACKKSKGKLVRKYYEEKEVSVGLPALTPAEDELWRFDSSVKLITMDFSAANYVFSGTKVKAGNVYQYTLRSCGTINGKKKYSEPYTFAASAFNNRTASCDLKILSSGDEQTLTVKLSNRAGNAPLLINKEKTTVELCTDNIPWADAGLVITEYSYDGTTWFAAKDNLYIFVNAKEKLYMKLTYKNGSSFDLSNDTCSLSFETTYLYDPDSLSGNLRYSFDHSGKLEGKTLKKLVMTVVY